MNFLLNFLGATTGAGGKAIKEAIEAGAEKVVQDKRSLKKVLEVKI